MLLERIDRRRALTIFAATAAAVTAGNACDFSAAVDYEWRGTAMGTDARILFWSGSETAIRAAIAIAVAEIERLENALSLFRGGSEICRLNRDGVLVGPSADMRRALKLGLAVADASAGLFDPTVQALWETHVDWFAADSAAGLPPDQLLTAARRRVDWRAIELTTGLITLNSRQRITLNGLGQGYITDRVAELLQARGFVHVLVDLGEQRALGPREDGQPWLVAREGADTIELRGGALATSEGMGCVIGAGGAAHHLFDPRTGRSAHHWRRLTVWHRSAALADALSTMLYVASRHEIEGMLARFPATEVWATDHAGREWRWRTRANAAPARRPIHQDGVKTVSQ